jgi:hypothetical protein
MWAIAIDRGTCVGDTGLDLGRVGLRGAVGRDLVQSVGGHFGGGCLKFEKVRVGGSSQKSSLQFDQGARSEPLTTLVLSANDRHLEEAATWTRQRQEHQHHHNTSRTSKRWH